MSVFRRHGVVLSCGWWLCVLTLAISAAISVDAQPASPLMKQETTANLNLRIFDTLWERVNTKYFDPNFNGVNWEQIKQIYRPRAANARSKQELLTVLGQMLGELKTSHVSVWPMISESKLEDRLRSDFDTRRDTLQIGYGFTFRMIEGKPVVTEVEPNSPARSAGVKPGWILTEINDGRVVGQTRAVGDLSEGKRCKFLFTDIAGREYQLELTSTWIAKRPVRISRALTPRIAYIKFDHFIFGTGNWLRDELEKLNSPAAIVLDLRGNRGGFVEEVKKCLSYFFADDVGLGTFIERNGKSKNEKIGGRGDIAFGGSVVVLVDDESYSGAEIFAQLIQENRRGRVVGTSTKGEALNSVEFGLPGDFRTSIAFRDYVTPRGNRIEGKGVKPDIEVPVTIDDIVRSRDAALEKVLEIIK